MYRVLFHQPHICINHWEESFVCSCIGGLVVVMCLPTRVTGRLIGLWPKIILEVDNEGDLPIHQACRQGNSDIVAILLQQDKPQKDIKLIQLARLSLDLKYWYVEFFCMCVILLYASLCVCNVVHIKA